MENNNDINKDINKESVTPFAITNEQNLASIDSKSAEATSAKSLEPSGAKSIEPSGANSEEPSSAKSLEPSSANSEEPAGNINPKGIGEGVVVENVSCEIPAKGKMPSEKSQFVASCINGNYPRSVIDILPENLTNEILKTKYEGFRLVQMCAVNLKDGSVMLNYSFGREYELLCYHLTIDVKTPIMSISEIFPPAYLYENEMHDLFGINYEHMSLDFKGNLYRLENKMPYLRKEEV